MSDGGDELRATVRDNVAREAKVLPYKIMVLLSSGLRGDGFVTRNELDHL